MKKKTQNNVEKPEPEEEWGNHDGNTNQVQDPEYDEPFLEVQPGSRRDEESEKEDTGSATEEFPCQPISG